MGEPTRVWYLEMDAPERLRPARVPDGVLVARAEVPLGSMNRWLYAEVGRHHSWLDRLPWSPEQWQAHAERVETWLPWVQGTPAGFSELVRRADGSVDVYVFGLLEPFQGRGVGGHLLTEVVRRAWAMGAPRVTVNTCELDGAHALANYRARGFEVVREAIEDRPRAGPAVS